MYLSDVMPHASEARKEINRMRGRMGNNIHYNGDLNMRNTERGKMKSGNGDSGMKVNSIFR